MFYTIKSILLKKIADTKLQSSVNLVATQVGEAKAYEQTDTTAYAKKGFSFAEILMATAALSILMLGFSQFTADIFNVSAIHATQLSNVNDARFVSERVITQVSRAAYIYPVGVNIGMSGHISINTSNSIAMLVPDGNGEYYFVAYFGINSSDTKAEIYEFVSDSTYSWTQNTCPAATLTYFSGNSSLIAKDINKESTTLQYIVDYQNSVYDPMLKGEISGMVQDNQNALIKGVDWRISQGTSTQQVIQIKGISKNVPRFIE